jgi:hypothetical protein
MERQPQWERKWINISDDVEYTLYFGKIDLMVERTGASIQYEFSGFNPEVKLDKDEYYLPSKAYIYGQNGSRIRYGFLTTTARVRKLPGEKCGGYAAWVTLHKILLYRDGHHWTIMAHQTIGVPTKCARKTYPR